MSAKITSVVNCASSCVLFMYFFFLHLWWITWHIPHVCDVDCCVTTAVLVFSYAKQIRKLINVTHVYLRSQNTCRKLTSTSAQLRSEVGTSGIAATLPCSPAASSNYFHTKWASLSNLPRWFYYGFLFFLCQHFLSPYRKCVKFHQLERISSSDCVFVNPNGGNLIWISVPLKIAQGDST